MRARGGEGVLGDARERRARPDFDEHVRAGLPGALDGVVEADGFADVAHPVLHGRQFLERGRAAEPGRDDRDRQLARGEFAERGGELVQTGSISGEWKAWSTARSFAEVPLGDERRSRSAWTWSRAPETTTDSGPLTAAMPTRSYASSSGPTLGFGGADGEHGAGLGDRLHGPSAGGHEAGRGVEAEDSGDVGGGDLADESGRSGGRAGGSTGP